MEISDFLQMVEDDNDKLVNALSAKGHDYANSGSALSCFDKVAVFVELLGIDTTRAEGVAMVVELVKIVRMCNLMFETRSPSNESLADTFLDAHGYLHLAKAAFAERTNPDDTVSLTAGGSLIGRMIDGNGKVFVL